MPFMRYVVARVQEYEREKAYRIYVTDGIRALISRYTEESLPRYAEWIAPKKTVYETRSSDDIINHIKARLEGLSDGNAV